MALPARFELTGAVLAGGSSRRMGRPKHALELPGGRTMIEAVVSALSHVCRNVVVLGDADLGLKRIDDLRAGHGPLGGIEALLASGLDEQYLVCPCDVPLITPVILRRLAVVTEAPATVLRVDGEEDFWPLPARIAATALDAVRSALDRDDRVLHELMRGLGPQVIDVSRDDAANLANVNTPDDYARLCTGAAKVLSSPDRTG